MPINLSSATVNAAYLTNDGLSYYLFTDSAVVIEKHLSDDYTGYKDILLDNSISIALTSVAVNYDKYSSGKYYFYSDSYHEDKDNYSILIISAINGVVKEVSFIKNDELVYWRGTVKSMTVDGEAKKIASGAFTGSGVQSVKLGDNITEIGDFAFLNETDLTSIVMETSIKKIGNSAFNGCESLKEITYNGVQAYWNEIQLDESWREGSAIKKVVGVRFSLSY